MPDANRAKVVIIGAGFGGLYAAKKLANQPVDVLVIDRHNFHLFSPLIYQVATAGLDASEVAYPVRGIFRGKDNVRFLMGEVQGIDPAAHSVTVRTNDHACDEHYDYLIIAAGSQTHYFGMDSIEQHSFALKTLLDAVTLRNHIIKLFEKAAWADTPAEKAALTTLVVVGGGPTGLETAGALQELAEQVLAKEYRHQMGETRARVLLVEMQDHLLAPYPSRLRAAALKQLEAMGVEVILGRSVTEASHSHIVLDDGQIIPTHTLVWSAGVTASPLARMLGVELHRSGRVPVERTLTVIGLDDVYAVGDIAYLEDPKTGQPYPMLIPPAKQQGMLAAENILRRQTGQPPREFHYGGLKDRGIMATVGRSRAVAWIFYRIQLTGFLAWLAWLVLHLVTLVGFRNRLNVFINWVWNYFTYDRAARIILERPQDGENQPALDPAPAHADEPVLDDQPDAEPLLEPALD